MKQSKSKLHNLLSAKIITKLVLGLTYPVLIEQATKNKIKFHFKSATKSKVIYPYNNNELLNFEILWINNELYFMDNFNENIIKSFEKE